MLLRRTWKEFVAPGDLEQLLVLLPIPASRSALVKPGHPELATRVRQARIRLHEAMWEPEVQRGFVLLLLDADEDPPAQLKQNLTERAKLVRADLDVACVVATRELENWFRAASASLAGVAGLPTDLPEATDPEIGSGENWLTKQLRRLDKHRKYTKPADALELAERMSIAECHRRSPSFRDLCAELTARRFQTD